jgi:hypothetical protein
LREFLHEFVLYYDLLYQVDMLFINTVGSHSLVRVLRSFSKRSMHVHVNTLPSITRVISVGNNTNERNANANRVAAKLANYYNNTITAEQPVFVGKGREDRRWGWKGLACHLFTPLTLL